MFSFESLILLLGLFVAVGDGETSTCLTVYEEGGAPAVFQSPKCPRWKLSSYASTPSSTERCQLAMHQGRRYHQEDRALCALDLRIPFPGTPSNHHSISFFLAVLRFSIEIGLPSNSLRRM